MRKVILNKCYGGFQVSDKAYQLYAKKKGLELFKYDMEIRNGEFFYKKDTKEDNLFSSYFTKDLGESGEISDEDYEKYHLYLKQESREDPVLIEVVEELGKEASGRCGNLVVVEIPKDLDYVIDDYDGIETLHEKVQEW